MTSKWSLYCITEEQAVTAWADVPLTVCPTDASHTINTLSVIEIETELEWARIPLNLSVDAFTPTVRIASTIVRAKQGVLRRMLVLAHVDETVADDVFTISIVDATHALILATVSCTPSTESEILNIPLPDIILDTSYVLEIHVNINTTSPAILTIDEIVLLCGQYPVPFVDPVEPPIEPE